MTGTRIPDSRIPDSRFRIPDSRFQIQDSRIPGFQDSRFQDSRFQDSGFRFRIQDSGFRIQDSGFQIPGFQDSRIPGFQIQDSRFQDSRIQDSRFQDSRIPGFQDSRIPGFQDSRIRDSGALKNPRVLCIRGRDESVPSAVADGWLRQSRTKVLIPTDLQPSATADGTDSTRLKRDSGFPVWNPWNSGILISGTLKNLLD
ncbi:MAG: hypothetical protein IPK58_12600 [Acidobacteria bacterium]|nr:hypothetical protein [Acidobacteriota bacterium]